MAGSYLCGVSDVVLSLNLTRYNGTDARILTGTQLWHEWVHKLEDDGWSITDASRGKPSYPAAPEALKKGQEFWESQQKSQVLYGTDCFGEEAYRHTVAQSLTRMYGMDIPARDVVFTPGGQFALYAAFSLMHQACPDGVFVSTQPGYLNYLELIQMATNTTDSQAFLPVELQQKNNYHFNARCLRETLEAHSGPIAGFVFCNPLNPTGQVISRAEWQDIAAILKRYDAPIIMDEAFMEVVFGEDKNCSLLHAAPELYERTFLFRSGTKALGFSGERLAFNTVPKAFREGLRTLQSRLLGNPAVSGQAVLSEAFSTLNAEMIHTLSSYYETSAKCLKSMLSNITPTIKTITPQGGFYLLAEMSAFMHMPLADAAKQMLGVTHDTAQTDVEIAANMLFGCGVSGKKGVAVIPASFFGVDPKEGMVRISFSPGVDEMRALGERLKHMIEQQNNG